MGRGWGVHQKIAYGYSGWGGHVGFTMTYAKNQRNPELLLVKHTKKRVGHMTQSVLLGAHTPLFLFLFFFFGGGGGRGTEYDIKKIALLIR